MISECPLGTAQHVSRVCPEISPRYPLDITHNIPKISPGYPQDIPKIFPRYHGEFLVDFGDSWWQVRVRRARHLSSPSSRASIVPKHRPTDDIVTSLVHLPTFRLSPSVETFFLLWIFKNVQLCQASSLVSNKTSPWIPEVNSGEATLRSSGRRSVAQLATDRRGGRFSSAPLISTACTTCASSEHRVKGVDKVKGGGG